MVAGRMFSARPIAFASYVLITACSAAPVSLVGEGVIARYGDLANVPVKEMAASRSTLPRAKLYFAVDTRGYVGTLPISVNISNDSPDLLPPLHGGPIVICTAHGRHLTLIQGPGRLVGYVLSVPSGFERIKLSVEG